MSKNNDPIELKLCDPLQDAEAIKRCLDYLRIEADRTGLPFAAHLIGVAAEAVSDAITLSEKSVAQVERNGGARNGGTRMTASAGLAGTRQRH